MGLTTGGQIGAKTAMNLDQASVLVNEIIAAARAERPDVIVLCHGGPISPPEDVEVILGKCPDVDGFLAPHPWSASPPRSRLLTRSASSRACR